MNAQTSMVRNIGRTYRAASDSQRAEGLDWYAEAHRISRKLALRYGVSTETAAGVIAALSPRMSWTQNVTLAERALRDGGASGCLYSNRDKADRIIAGADPLDVLGGDKVRAFYLTILNPSEAQAVVIDRHAHDIAVGRVTDDAVRTNALRPKGAYERYADAYRRAAQIAGISPAQMQAVTWVAWREAKTAKRAA